MELASLFACLFVCLPGMQERECRKGQEKGEESDVLSIPF